MAIVKAGDGLPNRMMTALLHYSHRCVHTVAHPRTAAGVEVIYAGHGLMHADGTFAIAIYIALAIVALVHVVWVHIE